MKSRSTNLSRVRDRIDAIDKKIQSLLVQRGNLVKTVAEIKSQTSKNPLYYRPEREALVLRKVMERECGPFSKAQMAALFRGIMSACLAVEKQLKVAFLGPSGTFSEMAAIKHFGESVKRIPKNSLAEVFQAVQNREVDLGVVPVENSTGGPVVPSIECMVDTPLRVCGETYLPIHQCFMRKGSTKLPPKVIYSHDQSFKQCRHWIEEHYPNAVLISVASNSQAAELAAKDLQSAAIAGEKAAEVYGLKIHAKNIEDSIDNTTHFFVIGTMEVPPSGHDKTAILVFDKKMSHVPDEAKIERIKIGRKGIYLLEVNRHQQEPAFHEIIDCLKEYKVMGSFPQAVF